jgi:hypothetical protein
MCVVIGARWRRVGCVVGNVSIVMWCGVRGWQAVLTTMRVLWLQVLWGVARALGLQHTQVHVTCRRVGGGFGGKVGPWLAAGSVAACSCQLLLVCSL